MKKAGFSDLESDNLTT